MAPWHQALRIASAAAVAQLALLACDSNDPGGTGGSAGHGPGGGGSSAVQCDGVNPSVFPAFDKSCAGVGDCVMKEHMIDCCGSMVAMGINAAEDAAFDAAETECQSQYPACGCAPLPTVAEDGQRPDGGAGIQLDCLGGSCSTFVP